jgi:hypothetical protein
MRFQTALPRLIATYEGGRLTPFIGAGMSRMACPDWPGLVRALEQAVAGRSVPLAPHPDPAELIRRANAAVRSLKARSGQAFIKAMAAALDNRSGMIPSQTRALARHRWPLVLTTNYDNHSAAAVAERPDAGLFSVIGRSPEDCQAVLSSLSTAGRSLLWALQGYLDAPHNLGGGPGRASLKDQLVVGHDEYRRVTYRAVHFRRAFAEVFRQRSLLFLGSGIRETYLQELFGEVLELYGPSVRPHYAFIPKGEVDPDFMLSRFQIVVIEYPPQQHVMVERWLNELADEAERAPRAPLSWSWSRKRRGTTAPVAVNDLEVVRGPLPDRRNPGECLAVSAGGEDGFFVSAAIRRVMQGWGVEEMDAASSTSSRYVGEYPGQSVFAVRARSKNDVRELSVIYTASKALFDLAAPRYRRIRMQLLAAGGSTALVPLPGGPQPLEYLGDVRPFPERYSFVQTVRAWGDWRRARGNRNVDCCLALHVIAPSVYMDLASGRIDVLELLSCVDLRFWAEIAAQSEEFERRLFQTSSKEKVSAIVRKLNLSPPHWTVEVSPAPRPYDPVRRVSALLQRTLDDLGVVPGSTLHFRRAVAPNRPARVAKPRS